MWNRIDESERQLIRGRWGMRLVRLAAMLFGTALALSVKPAEAQSDGDLTHCFWTYEICGCAAFGSCSGVSCPGTGNCRE